MNNTTRKIKKIKGGTSVEEIEKLIRDEVTDNKSKEEFTKMLNYIKSNYENKTTKNKRVIPDSNIKDIEDKKKEIRNEADIFYNEYFDDENTPQLKKKRREEKLDEFLKEKNIEQLKNYQNKYRLYTSAIIALNYRLRSNILEEKNKTKLAAKQENEKNRIAAKQQQEQQQQEQQQQEQQHQ